MKSEAALTGQPLLQQAEGRARFVRYRRPLRLLAYMGLALGDLVGLGLCFLAAAALVVDLTPKVIATGGVLPLWALRPEWSVLPLFLAIAVQRKPYSARFLMDTNRTARDVLTALLTASALTVLVVLQADQHIWRSALVVAVGTALGCGWLTVWRDIAMAGIRLLFHGSPIATLALIDDAPVELPHGIPVLLAAAEGLRPDRNDPMALDALARAIAGFERVIVCCSPERRAAWLEMLKGANVQGEFLLPELNDIGLLRTARVGQATTAVVTLGPLDTINRIIKRLFDMSVALAALGLLWPVLLITALAVRLDSPGPILFRQPRVGRGNRLFDVYKFRSMRTESCDHAGAASTARADTRITRVGGFIRRTSIDELPQIFNVLNGTMSIVGPRPHAVGSKAAGQMFWEADERYWHRHAIKPGITGLAQVNGWRGATETLEDLTNRVALDTTYLRDWSLWRDIAIILRTVKVLLHKNAY